MLYSKHFSKYNYFDSGIKEGSYSGLPSGVQFFLLLLFFKEKKPWYLINYMGNDIKETS